MKTILLAGVSLSAYWLIRLAGVVYFLPSLTYTSLLSLSFSFVLFAVPFFNEIASFASSYLLGKTGSMLLPYFAQYACYAAAVLITFAIAFISSKNSMRFVAYFEFCALGINTLRQIGKIGYLAISHQHISKSIYGWIVVLVVLAAVGAVMPAKRKKKEA